MPALAGRNLLKFNQTTMNKIIEWYVNEKLFSSFEPAVKVIDVTEETQVGLFRVSIEPEKK